MIKTIAYFPLQAARNSGPVIQALLTSLAQANIRAVPESLDCDAAVIWSVLWAGRMSGNRAVYYGYRDTGRPVVVIDIGSLLRGITWKVSIDHVTAQGYYGHTQDLDWDRPRRLGVSLRAPDHSQPHILIAAQHRHSLQVQDLTSMEQWVIDQIRTLRSVSDRPIRVRSHPRCALRLPDLPLGVGVEHPRAVADTYDSFDLGFDCHAVINHNSGPGIQAAIHGVRPMVHSSSLAHPVSVSMADIERPYDIDRDRWLVEICHTEYTLEEIQQGIWLKRLSGRLQ